MPEGPSCRLSSRRHARVEVLFATARWNVGATPACDTITTPHERSARGTAARGRGRTSSSLCWTTSSRPPRLWSSRPGLLSQVPPRRLEPLCNPLSLFLCAPPSPLLSFPPAFFPSLSLPLAPSTRLQHPRFAIRDLPSPTSSAAPRFSAALPLEDALDLVKDAFAAATERDIYTGDSVEIVIVTAQGVRKESLPLRRD